MTMKLKYYLRGLGTGIVVTALILGISLSHGKGRLSDEEIKKRAGELGMVEEFERLEEASKEKNIEKAEENETGVSNNGMADSQISSVSQDTVKAETDQIKADGSKTDEKEESKPDSDKSGFGSGIEKEDSGADSTEDVNNQPEDQKENSVADDEGTDGKTGKSIVLEVRSGDGSLSVAKRAEEAGLVADAKEFDRFLCSGGYDKRICTGKHEIPEGASMEEIAKLLIRKP